MTTTTPGTEALARLITRREARVAAATWTKGEHGLFTGSEPGDGMQRHRDAEGQHSDSRIHRAVAEGIESMKTGSVTSRTMEFSHNGQDRQLTLSNARDTTRPDTPTSEIPKLVHEAADHPGGEGMRPIVVNGTAVDFRVVPTGGPPVNKEPGMTRDFNGGTAMMGAADTTDAPAEPKAPPAPKPQVVQVQAPPPPEKSPQDAQADLDRDEKLENLEKQVGELRQELDGIEELAVSDAMRDMDAMGDPGGEADMPVSMYASAESAFALPAAFVAGATPALPESMVAAVAAEHELPGYKPGAFTAGNKPPWMGKKPDEADATADADDSTGTEDDDPKAKKPADSKS